MNLEDASPIGTVLILGTVPLFLVYFVSFQRMIASLDEAERQRFIREGALPMWRRLLGLAPIGIALFVDDLTVRSLAALCAVVQLVVDTRAHHRLLVAAGFTPEFIKRLTASTLLGGVAFVLLLVGLALGGGLLPASTP